MSRHWHWAGPLLPTTLMACFPAQGLCSCGTRAIADPRSPHAHTHRVGLELVHSQGATSNTSSVHTLTHSHPHMHMPCRAHAHAPAPAHVRGQQRSATTHTSSSKSSLMSLSASPQPDLRVLERDVAQKRPGASWWRRSPRRCARSAALRAATEQGGAAGLRTAQPLGQPCPPGPRSGARAPPRSACRPRLAIPRSEHLQQHRGHNVLRYCGEVVQAFGHRRVLVDAALVLMTSDV